MMSFELVTSIFFPSGLNATLHVRPLSLSLRNDCIGGELSTRLSIVTTYLAGTAHDANKSVQSMVQSGMRRLVITIPLCGVMDFQCRHCKIAVPVRRRSRLLVLCIK